MMIRTNDEDKTMIDELRTKLYGALELARGVQHRVSLSPHEWTWEDREVEDMASALVETGRIVTGNVDGSGNLVCMQTLYRRILEAEGYSNWKVKEINSGGGIVLFKTREVCLDKAHINSLPWFLHEMAHIKHRMHTAIWADYYTKLLDKYVVRMDPVAKVVGTCWHQEGGHRK
jgi:hypothetical protein